MSKHYKTISTKLLIILINSIGIIISVGFCVFSYFLNNFLQNLFLCLAINIFTSILAFDFITLLMTRNDEKKKEKFEIIQEYKILKRFSKQLRVRTEIYTLQFNELTQPLNTTLKGNTKTNELNPLDIHSIENLFMKDFFTVSKMGTSIIEAYYNSYKSLCSLAEKILFSIDLNHHENLKDVLNELVVQSSFPNGCETLILFSNNNQTKIIDFLVNTIKTYNGNIEDDIKNNKWNGNLFLNIANLYSHLSKTRDLVLKLFDCIKNIN